MTITLLRYTAEKADDPKGQVAKLGFEHKSDMTINALQCDKR